MSDVKNKEETENIYYSPHTELEYFLRVVENQLAEKDAKIKELERERDLAIAHDRQPYPTAWAYEQVCKADRKNKIKITELEEKLNAVNLLKENDYRDVLFTYIEKNKVLKDENKLLEAKLKKAIEQRDGFVIKWATRHYNSLTDAAKNELLSDTISELSAELDAITIETIKGE